MNATDSTKSYFAVYFILVALTLLTCGLSFVPHFEWHTSVGLTIAAAKATLIALVFMHLLSSNRLPWLSLLAALLWLSILLGLTLTDYLSRAVLSY